MIGTTVSLQGAIINNGAIQFNQTTLGTYSGNMSGSGQVEISGVGPVSFTGDNSYSGGTTVDIGSTLIGTATGLQGAVTNNRLIQNRSATSGTYRGNMSGTGSVEIESGGAITFTGLNTYSGGTTVDSGGTLIGSTTSLRGMITNNGLVRIPEPSVTPIPRFPS